MSAHRICRIFTDFCVGTGGSIPMVGSAIGVAAMGMEKIRFVVAVCKANGRMTPGGAVAGAPAYAVQRGIRAGVTRRNEQRPHRQTLESSMRPSSFSGRTGYQLRLLLRFGVNYSEPSVGMVRCSTAFFTSAPNL
ncbi:MAG TPA: hypothetical protein DCZ75_15195 [Geobacter sp.]|nr:hypothetical protein [Geobacter sp.]